MAKPDKQVCNRRGFIGLAGLSASSFAIPSILKEKTAVKSIPAGTPEPVSAYRTLRDGNIYYDNGKVVVSAYKAMRFFTKEFNRHFEKMRVYRMECPDFKFGVDYAEFFQALDYKKAEMIFQGKIEPSLEAKFSFDDPNVKTTTTYCYWIASAEGEPEGPLAVRVRDPEVWLKYEDVRKQVDLLQQKYPAAVKVSQIGLSTSKRPLVGLKVGDGKKCIALLGAVHAGEAGPEIIMYVLEKLLENHRDLLKKVSVVAIPSANPDMRDQLVRGTPWYLRRNPNMVDINRNFPANWEVVESTYGYSTDDPQGNTYRGPYPGSENETTAIADFFTGFKPRLLFSYHFLASIAGETLAASKDALQSPSFVDRCNQYARIFWEAMDVRNKQKEKIQFVCTSGSIPTWSYMALDMPAFDLEAPFDANDLARCRFDQTDKELLKKYQEKHLRGIVALLERVEMEK